jgi:hypothetical protein
MIVYGFVALAVHLAIDWVTTKLHAEQRRLREQDVVAAQAAAHGPSVVVQLGGPRGETARAVLTPYAGGTSIQVTSAGLDPSHSYSVWLASREGVRTSATTFQPNTAGVTTLNLTTPVNLAGSEMFGLSRLPQPGELAPTDVLTTRLA